MTKPRRGKVLVAAVALVVVTTVATTWQSSRRTETPAKSGAAREVVYTAARRPFKAVVTLDAGITAAAAVPVARQREGAQVRWSARTGDVVRSGQLVGVELPTATGDESTQTDARVELAYAGRQLQRIKKLNVLDIADAEDAVRKAPAAERAAARRALARTRLTTQQAVEDLEKQIAALRRAPDDRIALTAPAAGRLTISADGAAATVQPAGYLVTAAVDPLVLYRLLDDAGRPIAKTNTVQLTGLPARFTCVGLSLRDDSPQGGIPAAGQQSEQSPDGQAATATATATTAATCRVPSNVRVFAGIKATLAITVTDLPEALIVDAAAVRATNGDSGLVSLRRPDGRVESRKVTLGQTDGLSVVIIAGLEEGDAVLDSSAR